MNAEHISYGDCVLIKSRNQLGLVFRTYTNTLIVSCLANHVQHYKYTEVELKIRQPKRTQPYDFVPVVEPDPEEPYKD